MGHSPWDRKKLDRTEQLTLSLFFSIGNKPPQFDSHTGYLGKYLCG